MNEEMTREVEIDLKDLLCVVLKKYRTIILVALGFAFIGLGYAFVKLPKTVEAPTPSVLDVSVRLPGESDEAYNNRVSNVERAENIIDNIDALTNQVEIQNDYLSNSLMMQIDPLNVASSRTQLIVVCDGQTVGGIESLFNAYSDDILYGEYLSPVADELGYSVGAIQELISCELMISDNGYIGDDSNQYGAISLTVLGPTTEFTEAVLDSIVSEAEANVNAFSSSVLSHNLTVTGIQSSVSYNNSVRDKQLDSVTTLNSIQSQINNLNNNLDSIAKIMGLKDRTAFYELVDSNVTSEVGILVKNYVKYGAVGLILGFIIAAGLICFNYIWGRKILTQKQFFSSFTGIKKIGVCKPMTKRTKAQKLLDIWSSNDSLLSEDNTNKIISANLNNLSSGINKILVTGTVDSETVKQSIKKLGIIGDVILDMFGDSTVLNRISQYDGVVLVEQRGVSNKRYISDQIHLLKNSGMIIGAIIL